jgi:hypothetical protein
VLIHDPATSSSQHPFTSHLLLYDHEGYEAVVPS